MESLRVGACAQVQCLENSPLVRKSGSGASSSPSCVAYGASTSSADCCAFRGSSKQKKKLCAPLGVSGDALSVVARRSSSSRLPFSSGSPSSSSPSSSSSSSSRPRLGRVSSLTSPPRSTAAVAPVRSSLVESALEDIDSQDLEAETPALLEQCSDLDWKTLVDDLRSEANHGLHSAGLRALSLKALENLMGTWIHEQIVEGIELSIEGKVPTEEPGWCFRTTARDLRMEANLQAAEALVQGVDSTFDWETDVAELHQRILLQGGAEPSALRSERPLWQAWAHAQGQVVETSNKLTEEALASTAVNGHATSPGSEPHAEAVGNGPEPSSNGSTHGKSLFSLSAAVATGLALEGIWLLDAVAEVASPEGVEAAARAPSWLVPAVLVFPPLSYFLFNVYRDKVNPYARVTDWMFGVVALTIVSNLVMMAVWGVRLY